MKKRFQYLYACCLLLLNVSAGAQISISLARPQPFQVGTADMFSADLLNTGMQTLSIYLVGTIVQQKNGVAMVTGKTKVIDLPPGLMQVNEMLLQPSYNYGSPALRETGYLPYGSYELCLKAYVVSNHEEKGAGCIAAEITPLSPPLLVNPDNGSEIPTPYPLLVWLPPTPLNASIKVLYDLKLVEITSNQKPYDAIQRNFALLEQKDILSTNLQYPANAMMLETGKRYAWQVFAKTADGGIIGPTEVWTFTLDEPDPAEKEEPVNRNFIRLKPKLDTEHITVKDELKVVYDEKYGPVSLQIIIRDLMGAEIHKQTVPANVGENRFCIDLKEIRGLKNKAFYRLEVSASDRQTQYLMFKNIR